MEADSESLAQAAALLECQGPYSLCDRIEPHHTGTCPAYYRPAVAAALAELRHALAEKIQQWGKVTELFGEKERAYDRELAELRAELRLSVEATATAEALVMSHEGRIASLEAESDSLRAAVLQAFGSTRTHSEAWAKLSPLFDAGAQGRRILEAASAKGEGE
jgi:hypothetical protein